MSKLIKTEFIAIARKDFMESSVIFKGIARDIGAMSVIAKGYKRAKSRIQGEIDTLTVSEIVVYHKPQKDLHILKEAHLKEIFSEIYRHYRVFERVLYIASAIMRSMDYEERESVFNLFKGFLRNVNRHIEHIGLLECAFWCKYLWLNGMIEELGIEERVIRFMVLKDYETILNYRLESICKKVREYVKSIFFEEMAI